jgi:CDP-paratose 2-epimerase
MSVAIVTGASGLIGSESVRYFRSAGLEVIGVDNDMRQHYFGPEASTRPVLEALRREVPGYRHEALDIRDAAGLERLFREIGTSLALVIHTAAQPSHDWAATDPLMDFAVNANGTLNLLELTRRHAPKASFIFTSTNKVYGDLPNTLPLVEQETRWELSASHRFYAQGIDESMSIDRNKHSLFGVSKASADLMVQEYGRYFGMNTVAFRAGCLTGPHHAGAEAHGFLNYLMKCLVSGREYRIYGYKGKQVRDNLHSQDLVRAFDAYRRHPRPAAVYNIGGGRFSNASMLESIAIGEGMTGKKLRTAYVESNRSGDHIWWISDTSAFRAYYPDWKPVHDIPSILNQIVTACAAGV